MLQIQKLWLWLWTTHTLHMQQEDPLLSVLEVVTSLQVMWLRWERITIIFMAAEAEQLCAIRVNTLFNPAWENRFKESSAFVSGSVNVGILSKKIQIQLQNKFTFSDSHTLEKPGLEYKNLSFIAQLAVWKSTRCQSIYIYEHIYKDDCKRPGWLICLYKYMW